MFLNRYLALVVLLMISSALFGQSKPDYSIFLVGDAGEPSIINSPQMKSLSNHLKIMGSNSSVVFLGDNIYPRGMPSEDDNYRITAEAIINAQLDAAKNLGGNVFVIPGNHDWEKGKKNGMAVNNFQEEHVEMYMDSLDVYLPDNGCPGPVEINLRDDLVLILLNSQWFLHPWSKPGIDEGCQGRSNGEILAILEDIINRNKGKKIVIASHHPMFTYGIHGGVATWKDHIFPLTNISSGLYLPLPIIGSIYPLYRKHIGNIQDVANPVYRDFSEPMVKLFEKYPNIIHVAGHEHNLQYSFKNGVNYIVSGSGSKITPVKLKGYAEFVSETIGFARLDFYNSGKVDIVYLNENDSTLFKKEILNSIYTPEETVSEYSEHHNFKDSTATTAASIQYLIDSSKYWLVGENYRDVWAAPVTIPYLDIGNEKGGLKILQRGGGMQTKSLRLETNNGKQYVIRSIEKFAEKAVPIVFRETVAADLIQDQVSASNPYGAIAVPGLAEAAGIYHTNPKLLYVPDDPRFGAYRYDFANMLVLFEERPAGNRKDVDSFGNPKKIYSTIDMLKNLYKDNDNYVDQQWVLKSRIFDLYIGDWDRHDDQWRWAVFNNKKKKGKMYRPIPRDRDNAFFINNGLIMNIVKRKWAMPKFQGFDYDLKNPAGFMFNARYFDRSFLSEMDRQDWQKSVNTLQQNMTDSVIAKALSVWQDTVYQLIGDEIASKLKVRREKLGDFAMEYYEFLAHEVNVVGSNKKDYFKVNRLDNGETRVRVFKITSKSLESKLLYDRTFHMSETNEIRLYGLKGQDIFEIFGEVNKGIKIRVIGGSGKDEVTDNSRVRGLPKKTYVYDTKDNTILNLGKEAANKTSNDPMVNHYDRKDFMYNFAAPLALLNYNIDDGIFIGGGILATKHGFRKDPFKSQHFFLGSVAPKTFSWDFRYRSTYTNVIRKLDFKLNLVAQAPNYTTNFFGLGNETVFDQDIDQVKNVERAIKYYQVRFEHYSAEGLLSKRLGTKINFDFGFHWQGFVTQQDYEGDDRSILDFAEASGDSSIFSWKTYQGLALKLVFDTRNNINFPERGIYWNTDLRGYTGLNNASNRFTRLQTTFSFYHTFRLPTKLTFAARAGLGQNYGSYEYYQGQLLGGVQFLRGYRKTRFIGDRKAFTNVELRYHLARVKSRIIPMTIGLNGFYDAGRVWVEGEVSNKVHQGYGGGIWFAPLNSAVLAFELGQSEEELRFYFRLGYLF